FSARMKPAAAIESHPIRNVLRRVSSSVDMRIRDASPAVVNDAASESVMTLNAKWLTSGWQKTKIANAPVTASRISAGVRFKLLKLSVDAVTSHRAPAR